MEEDEMKRVAYVFSVFLPIIVFGESGNHSDPNPNINPTGSRTRVSRTSVRRVPPCMYFRKDKKNLQEGDNVHLRTIKVGQHCVTTKGFLFELVERTRFGSEVWKDIKTGYLWGDKYPKILNHFTAWGHCQRGVTKDSRGNISGKWKLPSKGDFNTAEAHGFRETFRDVGLKSYWTSNTKKGDFFRAYIFTSGKVDTWIAKVFPTYDMYLRCIKK